MTKVYKLLIYVTFFIAMSYDANAQSSDFTVIMDNIRTAFSTGTPTSLDASVTTYLNSINANGSWPDINYTDHSDTVWQPGNHWTRLSILCKAYSRNGSSYYGSTTLRQAIDNALTYWLGLSPQPYSINWYFRSISLPRDMGTVMVAMRYGAVPLTSTTENAIIACMLNGIPINQAPANDGSNLTDVAQHYIMRGCLTQDQTLLNQTLTAVSNSIKIENNNGSNVGDGFQADNSFTSHGPQLYLYGYGDVLLSGLNNISAYVKGTSYEMAANKMAILSSFIRKGMLKAVRGKYHDFNAYNRQISRPNTGKPSVYIFSNAKNVDLPQYASEYDAAISRINGTQLPSYQVAPEHIHFWRTDYTVHHRPKYMFGLRSVSTRTAKAESGNGENLKGYYETEGANFIAVNGDEYYNIFPVWEWNKIPGITVPEITTYPLRTEWGTNLGKVSFVGGVSDGTYGVSAYAMNDYNTQAKKSWFFFDDEVVCLGTGINSTAAEAINTTVNQCLLNGAVNVKANSTSQTLTNGSRQYTGNLQWAHHNNVGYFFPQGGNISLSNQAQSGTQKSINNSYSDAVIAKDVFKLWFQHGVSPSDGSYTYIVAPGKTLEEMDTYNAAQVQIWSNNSTSQVVYHAGLDMLQLVFYQAGSLIANGYVITTDNASTILIKNFSTTNKVVIVADPAQTLSTVNLSVQNIASGTTNNYKADLPTGLMAGSSATAIVVPPPISFVATGDAYVRNGSYATTNFPTGNLVIKNDGASGYSRKSFIQFDLSSFTKKLESASLQLYVAYANSGVTTTNWEFYEVTDNSWTETGINWNNQPTPTSNLIATIPGKTAGNYITIPITETVLSRLSADKKLSIRITSTTVGGTTDGGFAPREATAVAQRPTLIIYSTENASPSVSITSPIANTSYNALANITIAADATDADGTISKIEFFQGTTKLGESATAPYGFDWNNVAAGSYALTAKATDNNGAVAISDTINVTVVAPSPVSFMATGDAYVRDGSYATTNFPTGTLIIKNDIAGYARRSFIQFDLSSFTKELESASLQLYVAYANSGVTSTNWEIYEVSGNSWTETGINWNNQPTPNSNLIATIPGKTAGNYITIPITETVLSRLSADKKLSIRITSTGASGGTTDGGFASREAPTAAQRPTLILYGFDNNVMSSASTAKNSPKEQANTLNATNIEMYPNPVTDKLNVSVSKLEANATIRVYNILGNELRNVHFMNVPQEVRVENLPVGTYFVVVQNGNQILRRMIIKQ